MRFRRRLYPRGGSHETTIPKPLLLALDDDKKHDAIFEYKDGEWTIRFEERGEQE